jgi:hypothetical protein
VLSPIRAAGTTMLPDAFRQVACNGTSQPVYTPPLSPISATCKVSTPTDTINEFANAFGNPDDAKGIGLIPKFSTPSVIASAAWTGEPNPAVSTFALASIRFFMAVDGPPSFSPVLVQIFSNGGVNASGGGFAQAALIVQNQALFAACLPVTVCTPGLQDSWATTPGKPSIIQAFPGAVLSFVVFASAAVSPGGSAEAFADPFFAIDPSTPNADQYTLLFSPGITPALLSVPGPTPTSVPEPASAGLLATGLGLAVATRRWRPKGDAPPTC